MLDRIISRLNGHSERYNTLVDAHHKYALKLQAFDAMHGGKSHPTLASIIGLLTRKPASFNTLLA
ncbi:hypothetical protein D3C81_2178340 [compost metagenome]